MRAGLKRASIRSVPRVAQAPSDHHEAITIDDSNRTFSDQEFALILTRASEMARASDVRAGPGGGFSLEEMKAVAAEAGFDPALVERAARLLPHGTPSPAERVLGAPIRHRLEARFDQPLDADRAARLLGAIRAEVEQPGQGTADSAAVTWQSNGAGTQWLVNATSDDEGTRVRVVADRGAYLAAVGMSTLLGTLTAVIATVVGFEAIELQSMLLGWSVIAGIVASGVAIGRTVWARSGRALAAQLAALADEMGRTLSASASDGDAESTEETGPGAGP